MRDLIADNNLLLMALSRFGISLGFGDKSVAEVCSAGGVDCSTFLAVVNFISSKPHEAYEVKLPALMAYLKQAHVYFLEYLLPGIRRNLIEAISTNGAGDVSFLILKFFDEYTAEVRRHMEYEDSTVFNYVEALLSGTGLPQEQYNIGTFEATHHPIAAKLQELKEILIGHFHAEGERVDLLNTALYDIITCERDLKTHCGVEDTLFVPAVRELEEERAGATPGDSHGSDSLDANGDIELTARERDIVTAIARGLSNKEIAERLYISVHTVATHRRNICAKLNIHSASGMTLYAIIHGLITLEEANTLLPDL